MHQAQLRAYLQQLHERLWHIEHSPDAGLEAVIAILRQTIAAMEKTLRTLQEAEAERQREAAHGPTTEGGEMR